MTAPRAANNYRSGAGKAYLEQRTGATSDHVQQLRASLFAGLSGPEDTVLDFGCGTGGVLSRVAAGRRVGVEIGSEAAASAREKGIDVFVDLSEVPTDSVDLAISFHAIEHVETPAAILRELARVVKPGKRLRLIVPGENPRDPRQSAWKENADMHLFTWTPLIFGNLASVAGYRDIETRVAPMPTGSRLVRILGHVPPLARRMHARVADRLNAWNVILDTRAPA
jgi:SAM-dependent methyltransferase